MEAKSSKKPIIWVTAGLVVIAVLMLGSTIYQTTQHEVYIKSALIEFNTRTTMNLDLVEFESGLFSSTAITSLANAHDTSPIMKIRHQLNSSPFFKTTVKSTLDFEDPYAADIGDSALAQKIREMEIVSEVSSSEVQINTDFAQLPLDDRDNFTAEGVSAEIVIVPTESAESIEQYQAQTKVRVERITGDENGAKISFEGGEFTGTSIFNDEILNSSSFAGELESITITDYATGNFIRISGIDMQQETRVADLTDTSFAMEIEKTEIKNSVIEDVNIRTSLKNLDTLSLKQFFAYLMEETAQQNFENLSRFMEAGVGIFSKSPTFAVDGIEARINDAKAQLQGSVTVDNFIEFLQYGFTQNTMRNIDLKASITADKNIYAALAKLDFAFDLLNGVGPQSPTDEQLQQRAAMFKSMVEQNQLFKKTEAGIAADIKMVNGAGYVNDRRMM